MPSFEFPFDSYGLLHVAPSLDNWSLQHCSSSVAEQSVLLNGVWEGPLTGSASSARKAQLFADFAPVLGVENVCPLDYDFQCGEVAWRRTVTVDPATGSTEETVER